MSFVQKQETTDQEVSHVIRSKAAARRNYDRLSRWYDLFTGSEKRFTETGLKMLNVQPGECALEIGFGTGQSLVSLAQAVGEGGSVYGIDISEGMLGVAGVRISRAGLADRVELRLGDAADLTFESGFFNALFISFTLELFDMPEIPLMLGECKRVLRKDGRMGIVSMAEGDSLAVRLYEWAHTRMPNILDCRPIPVKEMVSSADFWVTGTAEVSMWGLPVQIVMARKP